MRTLRLILCLSAAMVVNSATAADLLHNRAVDLKNPGGKDLIIKFEELRRDERTSIAKVTRVSGASVPTAMFIVQGFYDIARIRNTAYFVNLKEWKAEDGGWMYLVGFANDDKISIQEYFNLSESDAASADKLLLSVKNYDRIFQPRK